MLRAHSLFLSGTLGALIFVAASHGQQVTGPPSGPANPVRPKPQQPQTTAAKPKTELKAAWKMLADAAASPKAQRRSDALLALTVLGGNRKAAGIIENALNDKEDAIRVLAATSLGEIKAKASIPALKKALEDKSAEVSFAAAQALWNLGDRSGRDIFYEVLAGERKTRPGVIQSHLDQAKQEMHDPKALALIGIKQASGAFLGPFSMGVSAIEEFATNKSAPVQALCARLLASDDTPETVEELEAALGDKNWVVRAAARALASMKHPEVVPQLSDMMESDKKAAARFAAAAAIIRLSRNAPQAP